MLGQISLSRQARWRVIWLRPAIRYEQHEGPVWAESASWADPSEGLESPQLGHKGHETRCGRN